MNKFSRKPTFLMAAALIIALAFPAYSGSFSAAFHFDDFHQLVNNQHMRSLANVPRFFTDASLASYAWENKGYRPLTYTSFALNYAVSGYDVSLYHAVNFALHIICAFLVFLIVRSVLEESGKEHADLTALMAAAVFAVHPAQTNAVTYISGRAALLASLFYLIGFAGFLRLRRGGGYIWWVVPPTCYLLGLLSKEMAVSLPATMLAYDMIFTYPKTRGMDRPFRQFYCYAPFAAALFFFLGLKRWVAGFFVSQEKVYSVGQYMMSEAKALLLYVRLMVFPINQNADYSLPVTSSVDLKVVAGMLFVALSLLALYRARKSHPAISFFGFWFFMALAPESSLFPITDIAVEYRLYLPSVGFIACAVLLAAGRLEAPAMRRGFAAAAVLLLMLLTFNRNAVWATERSLWTDSAKKSPHSARVSGSLASALMDEGDYAGAVKEFERALLLNPLDPQVASTYNNLGVCYIQLHMPARGAEMFAKVIQFEPGHRSAYVNLGVALLNMGKYYESTETLQKAVSLFPDFSEAHSALSAAYKKQGMLKEALAEARQAYAYSPMDFETSMELADLYELNGMSKEARSQAETSAGLANSQEQQNRARTLIEQLKNR